MHTRVAIVKLGAVGDVLRTTALLRDLLEGLENPHVTWFVEGAAEPVLRGNPMIDRIVRYEDAQACARAETFDAVFVLDNDARAARLVTEFRPNRRFGFRFGPHGTVVGVEPGCSAELYELGLWDDLKRANERPYLELLAETAGVRYTGALPFVPLDPAERAIAQRALSALPRPVIGVNTDAGGRWARKQWNLSSAESLVGRLTEQGFGVVALGESTAAFNAGLAARFPNTIAAQTRGRIDRLFAFIASLDVVLTCDTLCLHAAVGLRTPIVALFGPTSLPEISVGEGDIKLTADGLECLGCYLSTCANDPHCMDRLSPDIVEAALLRRLQYSAIATQR